MTSFGSTCTLCRYVEQRSEVLLGSVPLPSLLSLSSSFTAEPSSLGMGVGFNVGEAVTGAAVAGANVGSDVVGATVGLDVGEGLTGAAVTGLGVGGELFGAAVVGALVTRRYHGNSVGGAVVDVAPLVLTVSSSYSSPPPPEFSCTTATTGAAVGPRVGDADIGAAATGAAVGLLVGMGVGALVGLSVGASVTTTAATAADDDVGTQGVTSRLNAAVPVFLSCKPSSFS
mmetsp:Transcript_37724/g.82679  ORF Transcript_37724/g.82679 Transcript_37724/m.82679 type:complete len:229 (+) Transcript_37724:1413-2099(+)